MIDLVEKNLESIRGLCRRYGVTRLGLIGSAATGRFNSTRSDLDFVVEFAASTGRGLDSPYFRLLLDLEDLLGVKVDLIELPAVRRASFLERVKLEEVRLYAA